MTDLDNLIEELGAVLAAPDAPRHLRNEPGADKKWRAGDLLADLGKHEIEMVASKLGADAAQLRAYAKVARAIPPDERTARASWATYRELADVSAEVRKSVMYDGITLRRAREAIGKDSPDRPRKQRQPDEVRAWAVIEELAEPRIRAIVEREMNASGTDRKARRAMRTTVDEINARRKLIEAELRKQQREGSPDRRFWEASKELITSEQIIFSLARLHEQHAEAMSEERWQEIIKKLGSLADAALEICRRIEGHSAADFIDGVAVEDQLALPPGAEEDVVDAEVIDE